MPHCDTRYFGRLEYSETAVVEFPEGLPGFPLEKRFVLVEPATHHPLVFLQSLTSDALCFLAVPVQCVVPGYRLSLSAEELALLGLSPEAEPRIGRDVLCLAIVFVGEDGSVTANLLAPVVIHLATRRALQCVPADPVYPLRYPMAAPEAAPCS
ncbi:MAG: flagellar assembly protein FliW [Bryobacterales bacterium]|nr:flagellar assembly protein FliW [Bryobacteraceae bacterium]MDW8354475.1 flagellar assembly protein FliW [Bryobacterales bacterium]